MGNYIGRVATSPKTLTDAEQALLLRASGEHRDGFRDHMIFSLALGTGLREHELLALDVGDVLADPDAGNGNAVRRRIILRTFKGCRRESSPETQEVLLPDSVRVKLGQFLRWKKQQGESLDVNAPLLVSRQGNRLSARQLRHLWSIWQQRAGFERPLPFHCLRHTACTAVYRATKDIRLTQRFARHASVVTTSIYTHASDQDLLEAVRGLEC